MTADSSGIEHGQFGFWHIGLVWGTSPLFTKQQYVLRDPNGITIDILPANTVTLPINFRNLEGQHNPTSQTDIVKNVEALAEDFLLLRKAFIEGTIPEEWRDAQYLEGTTPHNIAKIGLALGFVFAATTQEQDATTRELLQIDNGYRGVKLMISVEALKQPDLEEKVRRFARLSRRLAI